MDILIKVIVLKTTVSNASILGQNPKHHELKNIAKLIYSSLCIKKSRSNVYVDVS